VTENLDSIATLLEQEVYGSGLSKWVLTAAISLGCC